MFLVCRLWWSFMLSFELSYKIMGPILMLIWHNLYSYICSQNAPHDEIWRSTIYTLIYTSWNIYSQKITDFKGNLSRCQVVAKWNFLPWLKNRSFCNYLIPRKMTFKNVWFFVNRYLKTCRSKWAKWWSSLCITHFLGQI